MLSFLGHAVLQLLLAGVDARQPQPAAPQPFSSQEFRSLRWIVGRWRGSAAGGQPFYEQYDQINDSTIAITYYESDSTWARPSSTGGTVELRGGHLYHTYGSSRWAMLSSDQRGLHFTPVTNASNRFSWRMRSPQAWDAVLYRSRVTTDTTATTYTLTRVAG